MPSPSRFCSTLGARRLAEEHVRSADPSPAHSRDDTLADQTDDAAQQDAGGNESRGNATGTARGLGRRLRAGWVVSVAGDLYGKGATLPDCLLLRPAGCCVRAWRKAKRKAPWGNARRLAEPKHTKLSSAAKAKRSAKRAGRPCRLVSGGLSRQQERQTRKVLKPNPHPA